MDFVVRESSSRKRSNTFSGQLRRFRMDFSGGNDRELDTSDDGMV
jgi:hypothetical protein